MDLCHSSPISGEVGFHKIAQEHTFLNKYEKHAN